MSDFGLYVIITNPGLPYGDIAEVCGEEGIHYLQLREKNLNDKQLLQTAKTLKDTLTGSQTKVIINDRIDIAVLSGADGVHLGQDDLSPQDVKQLWQGDKAPVIGLSSHSPKQLETAVRLNPDYVGFGPVYRTPTKAIPDPEVGTELIPRALEIAGKTPVVCIGGLFPENIEPVLAQGARNLCLVRFLMQSENKRDFRQKINNLQRTIKERK